MHCERLWCVKNALQATILRKAQKQERNIEKQNFICKIRETEKYIKMTRVPLNTETRKYNTTTEHKETETTQRTKSTLKTRKLHKTATRKWTHLNNKAAAVIKK